MRYLLILALLLAACGPDAPAPESEYGTMSKRGAAGGQMSLAMADQASAPQVDQKLIRNGQLTVEVADLDSAEAAVRSALLRQGGRIEAATRFKDEQIHLRIRVPASALDPTIALSAALGRVISRTVSESDVTTSYIDTQARLKTRLALRDRLAKLLETAESVEDILNIERELARVQGEIDGMQGQLDYLDRQVDESTLDLTLQTPGITPPEPRPGPLGYVFVGLWKAVKWLFIWD